MHRRQFIKRLGILFGGIPFVRAHFSTGVFLDGEVVYMLMDEGAA